MKNTRINKGNPLKNQLVFRTLLLSTFLLATPTTFAQKFKLNAKHDNSIAYCLPFARNNTFTVSQVENGKTHKNNNRFAYDIMMPIGTPVHAARKGIVKNFKDSFTDKAQTEEFKTQGNFILVEHSDGTYGIYAHLDKKGVIVKVGQTVKEGQLIGYSGNTGFTSGPHLHFEVLTFTGKSTQSFPIKFHTGDIVPVSLEAMKSYRAPGSCNN